MTKAYRSQLMRHRTVGLANRILQRDSGASIVEFALVIPFLLALMIGVVELSNLFFMRHVFNDLVGDAARRLAVGALDEAGTEKFVLSKLAETSNSKGDVQISESKMSENVTDVTVSLSIPINDVLLFGSLTGRFIASGDHAPNLTHSATMLKQ